MSVYYYYRCSNFDVEVSSKLTFGSSGVLVEPYPRFLHMLAPEPQGHKAKGPICLIVLET
jgi:hypothetical protein